MFDYTKEEVINLFLKSEDIKQRDSEYLPKAYGNCGRWRKLIQVQFLFTSYLKVKQWILKLLWSLKAKIKSKRHVVNIQEVWFCFRIMLDLKNLYQQSDTCWSADFDFVLCPNDISTTDNYITLIISSCSYITCTVLFIWLIALCNKLHIINMIKYLLNGAFEGLLSLPRVITRFRFEPFNYNRIEHNI